MPVGVMLDSMDAREFRTWQLLDYVEYQERKKKPVAAPSDDEIEELE